MWCFIFFFFFVSSLAGVWKKDICCRLTTLIMRTSSSLLTDFVTLSNDTDKFTCRQSFILLLLRLLLLLLLLLSLLLYHCCFCCYCCCSCAQNPRATEVIVARWRSSVPSRYEEMGCWQATGSGGSTQKPHKASIIISNQYANHWGLVSSMSSRAKLQMKMA